MDIVLTFVIIFFSLVLHEVSHGQAAKILGDDTAEKMGRLSLNPFKHIDPIGTILVPLLLVLFATMANTRPFVFG
jgi:Zn-dependent protease